MVGGNQSPTRPSDNDSFLSYGIICIFFVFRLYQVAPTTANHLTPTSDNKFRPSPPMAFTSLAVHPTESQQVSSIHQTAMNTVGQSGSLFYPTELGYTCAPGPVVPHGHDRSHKFNGMEHSDSFYINNGQSTSRMCNSISNLLFPLASMTPFGVVKPSEPRGIGPYPIYEGMENWSRFDNLTGVQWTRVPASKTNEVRSKATNKQPLPSSRPLGISELYTSSRPTTEHGLDRGRRRSVTRLQLSIPKPATVDTMFTSFSSSTTRNMDISVNQPSDNTTSMVKRRTNLRRATTISPIRRRAEPVTSVDAAHTHGQLAGSSGFASAGSIAVAVEDAVESRHRPPVPLPTDETENRAVDSGLPPPVDVHAYPFVSDLRKGMDQSYQTTLNASGQLGDLSKVPKEVAFKESTVQLPTTSKFLLGRVASNDDICIRTETPFALTIAATENEISITKVSSVSDLKQLDEERTAELLNSRETQTRIKLIQAARRPVPVLLRLTFGSESNLICDATSPPLNKVPQYRATCYLDLPCGSKVTTSKNQVIEPTHSKATNNPFRHSLPCIPYRADQQRPTELKS
ncbi:hypothetical protein PHET_02668 [Paragonimus heterotremus]|uniref:Uncharacterized protein n=1 Tax=Paragonimus heterotremus TaxID=100268 RepID=A0A8J4TQ29_9TREM|nr:hypothetical protein PHET_02668 [Paragonimus heterotremus]